MHGLGNDFVVIDGIQQKMDLEPLFIRHLANRHTGIGFDQLLLILSSQNADIVCRIFNADGSEAEQCGNGMRCVARFAIEKKLISNKKLTIETLSGIVHAEWLGNNLIKIILPVKENHLKKLELFSSQLNQNVSVFFVSLGNPHAIVCVDHLDDISIDQVGAEISSHPIFSSPVNVGFMQKIDSQTIRLKTFERGVGETLACGSNAAAAVMVGILEQQCISPVTVQLTLGELQVIWSHEILQQIGPAEIVFEGVF